VTAVDLLFLAGHPFLQELDHVPEKKVLLQFVE